MSFCNCIWDGDLQRKVTIQLDTRENKRIESNEIIHIDLIGTYSWEAAEYTVCSVCGVIRQRGTLGVSRLEMSLKQKYC